MNDRRFMILDDGESFGGADGSALIILDVPDDSDQITEKAHRRMSEDGDICPLVDDIEEGRTPGRIVEMSALLELREAYLEFRKSIGNSEDLAYFKQRTANLDLG